MWFLYLLSWIALLVQISFITVSLAAGLYYIAELVEEYTVLSKKIIRWMTVTTLSIYLGFLLFEDLPTSMIVCGLLAQVAHLLILQTFPYVSLSSPSFIFAVILLLVNHYLAFKYFNSIYHSFSEVMAYFTLCLWLVPFALFVSLSANENVLPTISESTPLLGGDNDVVTNYFSTRNKKYGLLTFFNYAKDSILPQRSKKTF
ncbi:protein TEX261-like [Macrosteles quadrilineatus]|uniref:protein TEX261-like n=1 Tax=Macrosteles quadrilineatus TaxID=74068 RepID=UPI0023E28D2E|nr:protein TEX261-like [Macrosteles quadrilineatus]XP_054288212.1 protein TEX261-like [Macrosteles quadrilineatus]